MKKPIFVTQSSMPPFDEYIDEIRPIFETKWLTNMGEKHIQFEEALKDYLKIKNISLFTNGHMALFSGIHCLDFAPGSEVITTPFTFSSTIHSIVQNRLIPVFCDINPEDYTIDVNKIEELITDKTVAIIPVHVYGHICDVERLEKIAKKHNLKIIYDAAHVFGVTYKGKSIVNYGDMSMFSFHATKVFNSIEGGSLIYNDDKLKTKIDYFKNFGLKDADHVVDVGLNAKMNEFCAAMGICNLRHLEEEISKREKVYNRYIEKLSGVPGIQIPKKQHDVEQNYSYFPILFDKKVFGKSRDDVMKELEAENIFARKYFYPLVTDYECYKGKFGESYQTPIAKYVSDNILTVPMFADLPLDVVDIICDIILNKKGVVNK